MRAVFFAGLFCLLSNLVNAQTCDCGAEFNFLKSYIERNYPGFTDKTSQYLGHKYIQVTDEYAAKTAAEKNTTYCMMFMKEWLRYFQDEHLQIVSNPLIGNDSDILAERIRNAEVLTVPADTIKKIRHSNGVEGVYYEYDSVYKVAVVRSQNSWRTYAAVVLESRNVNWKPGMVKFELKEKTDSTKEGNRWYPNYPCIFHMGNLGIYTNKVMNFNGYALDGGLWTKEGLKESAKEQAARKKRGEHRGRQKEWSYLEFSRPDKQCTYLRVSNFDSKVADVIDSFVAAKDSILSHTPYMILDLRGNGGGAERSYQSLLPYLYTNRFITAGTANYATRDNIDADKLLAASIEQEDVKKWLQQEATVMEGNYGRYTPVINDTFQMDSVKAFPQKIAILVDSECTGTTEQFLLAARQSSKVVVMGQATNGSLDYSNKRRKKFSCIPYTLEYPIARSGRLPAHPIDNIGVKPDVRLTGGDWIKEAVKYLKTGKL